MKSKVEQLKDRREAEKSAKPGFFTRIMFSDQLAKAAANEVSILERSLEAEERRLRIDEDIKTREARSIDMLRETEAIKAETTAKEIALKVEAARLIKQLIDEEEITNYDVGMENIELRALERDSFIETERSKRDAEWTLHESLKPELHILDGMSDKEQELAKRRLSVEMRKWITRGDELRARMDVDIEIQADQTVGAEQKLHEMWRYAMQLKAAVDERQTLMQCITTANVDATKAAERIATTLKQAAEQREHDLAIRLERDRANKRHAALSATAVAGGAAIGWKIGKRLA